jgi:hypothetical protein
MNDFVSGITSYGMGAFALFFQQDLSVYVTFFGLVLVVVRILGDIPKALSAWRKFLNGGTPDDGSDT